MVKLIAIAELAIKMRERKDTLKEMISQKKFVTDLAIIIFLHKIFQFN